LFLPEKTESQDWLGVLIAVPEPWNAQITDLREELGDKSAFFVPAHITLVPPIPVEKDQREDVIRHLRAVSRNFPAFRMRIGKVDTFAPVSPVLFLSVDEGAAECVELADQIRGGPLNYNPRFSYHPHVTLSMESNAAEYEELSKRIPDFGAEWTVPGFRLDKVSPNGAYSSVAIFDFAL